MRRALALARRGEGRVEPNPMVGCVIARRGRIVGEGYHRRFGGPHAEVHALRAAGKRAAGSTVYVTLEPCCHHGKTPPCTDALIAAKVRRVVAAMRDPFPPVGGRGVGLLRNAGIDVDVGLCEAEAKQLTAPYIKRQRTGRPWVILKWAQSLDGKIATHRGESQWISGEASRRRAHQLRGRVDAIVVGVGTVTTDDPLLTCRHVRPRRIATRIVLDPNLRTPLRAKLITTARKVPTLLVVDRKRVSPRRIKPFERAGAEVLAVNAARGSLDLGSLLDELGQRSMTNVLVEGGSKTLGSFFDADLVDEFFVFVAPRLIGGADAPAGLGGIGIARMKDLRHPHQVHRARCGDDDLYQLRLHDPGPL